MKKFIAVLALLALVSVGAFAQIQMSAGGGLIMDINGGNGVEAPGLNMSFDHMTYGFYGFFDATYVEVNAAFLFGTRTAKVSVFGLGSGSGTADFVGLNLSLLGKYPFNLGSVTVFPLVGLAYNMVLSIDGHSINVLDFNQLALLAGVGLDYSFSEKLFLRASALFQLRFPSKDQEDAAAMLSGASSTLGMGTVIKVAIGYRF